MVADQDAPKLRPRSVPLIGQAGSALALRPRSVDAAR
jgi:hypothetical protein